MEQRKAREDSRDSRPEDLGGSRQSRRTTKVEPAEQENKAEPAEMENTRVVPALQTEPEKWCGNIEMSSPVKQM